MERLLNDFGAVARCRPCRLACRTSQLARSIRHGGRHALALEDLVPFAERQAVGDQQGGALTAV